MSKSHKSKPRQLSLKRKSLLAPRLFAIFALLIVIALAISALIPLGAIR